MQKLIETSVDRSSKTIKALVKDMVTQYPGMTRKTAKRICNENIPDAMYVNEKYVVSVFKNEAHGFGDDSVEVWHLSIRRQDREACHDWRDFQAIKNQVCGPEYEGLELYPAETRVLDAANQYHIYVIMHDGIRVPVGYQDIHNNGRDDRPIGKSKQRQFKDSAK